MGPVTPTDLPDLRIPPGYALELPVGWSYGDLQEPGRRVLLHDTGVSLLVSEVSMEDTVDAYVLRGTLELALEMD